MASRVDLERGSLLGRDGVDESDRHGVIANVSYGSLGVEAAENGRSSSGDKNALREGEGDEDDDLKDFLSLVRGRDGEDGGSLARRWSRFLTRPRWWLAVIVLVTLYTLYTNQAKEVTVPEPGYMLEPNVYETKWWDRWWSPWGGSIKEVLHHNHLARGDNATDGGVARGRRGGEGHHDRRPRQS